MKFVLYTNSVSAHQLPLAREIVKRVGRENFRYVYTGETLQGGAQEVSAAEPWIVREGAGERRRCKAEPENGGLGLFSDPNTNEPPLSASASSLETHSPSSHLETHTPDPSVTEWLENCNILMTGGLRPIDLIERRAAKGLKTFYQSERWFKPLVIRLKTRGGGGEWNVRLPGKLRMLVPGYRRMAKRFVLWLKTDPNARCLAIGPWAKKDFEWLGVPPEKIVDWGYFVEPSGERRRFEAVGERRRCEAEAENGGLISSSVTNQTEPPLSACASGLGTHPMRVLWVGRMLALKHVDTIIRAVALANRMSEEAEARGGDRKLFSLTLVGDGPERPRLQKLAKSTSAWFSTNLSIRQSNNPSLSQFVYPTIPISFLPPVPIAEVRPLMRTHDIYVFSSDAQDGWGAVVSEALTEGMTVLGTIETGASAALLPKENLFHTGDWKVLAEILVAASYRAVGLSRDYTPAGAADRLMTLMGDQDGPLPKMAVK